MKTLAELEQTHDTPVIMADSQGMITYVNACFETCFRWQADSLVGTLLTTILTETYRDAHNLAFSRFVLTGARTLPQHALELEVLCGDGTSRISLHTIIAEQRDGEWVLGAALVPQTSGGESAAS